MYYTENGGNNYTNISSGLVISEIYKIGQATFRENRAMCGYQDNGSTVYRGPGDWATEIGGDGMECAVDPTDANYMYGELYYGAIRRSTNGGRTFGSITNGISDQGAWVTPFMIDEDNPNIMFVGMGSVWRTTNLKASSRNSISWRDIGGNIGSSNSTFSVLEQSEADPNVVYAARGDGRLFRTDNARASSPTWTDLTSGMPSSGAPSDLEAHPWDPDVIYMTKSTRVYVSTNKGQSWTNISGNLPGVALRTIVYDRFSQGGLFVGGTPGVYYIDSSMTQWTGYSDGLPGDVSVTELEIFYDTIAPANSRLRAGTYGRGMWSAPLFDIGSRAPEVKLYGDTGYHCMQNPLKFFADSSENATSWNWSFSPASVNFVSGTTAASENIEVNFTQPGFYSVTLIVSNYYGEDTITYQNAVHVDSGYLANCVTTTQATSATQRGISNVSLAGMMNMTATFDGTNSNHDYSCNKVAHLEPSTQYTLSVTTSSQAEFVEVYIDYNGDGDFTDAGENILSLTQGVGMRSGSFTTPSSPMTNKALRMRVISDPAAISQPCQALTQGESEDYGIFFNEPSGTVVMSDTLVCPKTPVWISLDPDGKTDGVTWNFGADAQPQTGMGIDPIEVSYGRYGTKYITATINGVVTVVDSIEIVRAPTADLMIDSTQSSLCDGGHMLLTVPGNTGIPTTYTWFRNGIVQTSATDSFWLESNLNFFLTNEYRVVANGNGCIDTSDIITTKPFASPVSWVNVPMKAMCLAGNEFEFEDISLLSEGTLSRTWYLGDGSTSTQEDVKHSYSSSGVYTVKLVSSSEKGCMDSTTVTVTVQPSPDAGFSFVQKSRNKYDFAPHDVTLKSYYWEFGDGDTSTRMTPTHEYATAGSFNVKLTVENLENCDDTLSQKVDVEQELGLEEGSVAGLFRVFPNPSHGNFNLSFDLSGDYELSLYNALGQVEWQESVSVISGEVIQKTWTVPGWYVLRVVDAEGNGQQVRLEIQ
ncbi:PKD domain-containing protein [bacterium SCSIO 12741]|nr:PKD domain-containing protein [bacterium SCSIO 12741]